MSLKVKSQFRLNCKNNSIGPELYRGQGQSRSSKLSSKADGERLFASGTDSDDSRPTVGLRPLLWTVSANETLAVNQEKGIFDL